MKLACGSSQQAIRQVKSGTSWGMRLSLELQMVLTPPVAASLLVFTVTMMAKLLVFNASSELQKGE